MNINLLLNFFFISLVLESFQRLSAVPLLGLKLLLKNFDGLIEGFNSCALHLKFLRRRRENLIIHFMSCCILPSEMANSHSHSEFHCLLRCLWDSYLRSACVLLVQRVVLAALLLVLLMIDLQLLSNFLNAVLFHQLNRAKTTWHLIDFWLVLAEASVTC